ncbi:MAG: transcriptional repressor [bacterium]
MPVSRFRSFLRSNGYKCTPEREMILEEALAMNEHFDIENLWLSLYQKKKRVSKASVYRTIGLLLEGGFLSEVMIGDRTGHYESAYCRKHHDHLLCKRCGRIIEFESPEIEAMQDKVCSSFGFVAESHHLEIAGICSACRKKESRK